MNKDTVQKYNKYCRLCSVGDPEIFLHHDSSYDDDDDCLTIARLATILKITSMASYPGYKKNVKNQDFLFFGAGCVVQFSRALCRYVNNANINEKANKLCRII